MSDTPTNLPPRFLRTPEAARFLGLSGRTLEKHRYFETGLAFRPAASGEKIAGVVRQRLALASGRFAMIDDGLGFQLVPWASTLE